MANNDKALLLVLDLREKQEQNALEIYIQAQNKITAFKQQIAQIEQYKESYINEMQQRGMTGFSAQILLSYQDFLDKLDDIKKRQEQQLALAIAETERKREAYLQAQKQRKIIDTLLEKHKIQRQKLEAIKEQKLLDDFVVSHASRHKK